MGKYVLGAGAIIKGTLKRIRSSHQFLRSDEVEGFFLDLPEVGYSFAIFSKSLDPEKDARMVSTSRVQEVEILANGNLRFTTGNSTYELALGVGVESRFATYRV